MAIRFMYNNLIDALADAAITASTEASGYPVENVRDTRIGKKWRTTGAAAAEYATFDFGAAVALTCAVIGGHDLTSGDSSIQLRKSSDNFAMNDDLVASFTYSSEAMAAYCASTSERYWRIAFTKSAAAQIRNIGRIFLGTYIDPSKAQNLGWQRTRNDMSVVKRGDSGVVFTDTRNKYWSCKFALAGIALASWTSMRTMIETVGVGLPFFMDLDPATAGNTQTHYGRFKAEPPETEMLNDYFQTDIEFEEEVG